jgi:hypothetical protein
LEIVPYRHHSSIAIPIICNIFLSLGPSVTLLFTPTRSSLSKQSLKTDGHLLEEKVINPLTYCHQNLRKPKV